MTTKDKNISDFLGIVENLDSIARTKHDEAYANVFLTRKIVLENYDELRDEAIDKINKAREDPSEKRELVASDSMKKLYYHAFYHKIIGDNTKISYRHFSNMPWFAMLEIYGKDVYRKGKSAREWESPSKNQRRSYKNFWRYFTKNYFNSPFIYKQFYLPLKHKTFKEPTHIGGIRVETMVTPNAMEGLIGQENDFPLETFMTPKQEHTHAWRNLLVNEWMKTKGHFNKTKWARGGLSATRKDLFSLNKGRNTYYKVMDDYSELEEYDDYDRNKKSMGVINLISEMYPLDAAAKYCTVQTANQPSYFLDGDFKLRLMKKIVSMENPSLPLNTRRRILKAEICVSSNSYTGNTRNIMKDSPNLEHVNEWLSGEIRGFEDIWKYVKERIKE